MTKRLAFGFCLTVLSGSLVGVWAITATAQAQDRPRVLTGVVTSICAAVLTCAKGAIRSGLA